MPMALFLMFIGGAGKSAMFPLHIWLPDAMEANSCVSLIHAATMVVAGVSQVASLFPIWVQYAPNTLHYVAYIAAFTAFYAAAVACCQRDIKRGLAFSTISQIAYMLVALGVCFAVDNHHGGLGYMAGIFHLFTHAMFKALLFLCSGAIIVIIGSNFKEYMGGLHKYMPITNICFLIGCLAIAGIPPFAGFWSKDEIISAWLPVLTLHGLVHDSCGRYDRFLYVPPLLRDLLGTELLRVGSRTSSQATGGTFRDVGTIGVPCSYLRVLRSDSIRSLHLSRRKEL